MQFHKIPHDGVTLSYPLGDVVPKARKAAREMAKKIKEIYPNPSGQKFAFLCQGTSGSMMAAMVSTYIPTYQLRLVVIRKPNEKSHSGSSVPYIGDDELLIIADDFISSGDTIRRIYSTIEQGTGKKPVIDIIAVTGYCNREQYFNLFEPNHLIAAELRD